MFFRSAYHLLAYYFTLLLFGVCGLNLSLLALITSVGRSTPERELLFQRMIHRHFAFFHWWCAFARLVQVRYHGFETLPRGVIIAANHPALIDITCLLARVPEALCIFKPGIRRNPVLGAAARQAGYLASDGGHDLLRHAADKVAGGHTLIVFPEGTRTPPGTPVQPFKPGFVIIARRAHAPLQLVRISTDSDVLTKGRAWWRLPKFPAHIHLMAGPLIHVDPAADTAVVAAEVEAWFHRPLCIPLDSNDRLNFV